MRWSSVSSESISQLCELIPGKDDSFPGIFQAESVGFDLRVKISYAGSNALHVTTILVAQDGSGFLAGAIIFYMSSSMLVLMTPRIFTPLHIS